MTKTILLVNGDPRYREQLCEALADRFVVREADGYRDALAYMYKDYKTLTAVLLCVNASDADNGTLLEQRRDNPVLSRIPVIVLVMPDGKGDTTAGDAKALGADKVLVADGEPDELVRQLLSAIAQQEEPSAAIQVRLQRLKQVYQREEFLEKAAQMIHAHSAGHYIFSYVNIQNFKMLNDQYGSDVGDRMLEHVERCIHDGVAKIGGISCRMAADNFAALFPADKKNTAEFVAVYQKASAPPFLSRKIRMRVGRYRVVDLTLSVNAMYDRAKIAGDSIREVYDCYVADFTDSMHEALRHKQQILNNMEAALEADQFEAFYQPQYNHATGAIIGAEALVRWKRDGVYISPADFIPIFEQTGFIYEMDLAIWEQVCAQMRCWLDKGLNPLPVSVNISRRDLFHEHFIQRLTALLQKYRLSYDLIRLEVTESAFVESSHTIIARVDELIRLGFTVEIDDFGSGYSSLNTLKDVPASILKLDMKFFENNENTQRGGNIVESVVRMAKWLGMAVIAEGVENREQADYLKSIGCYYIQGYLYAKPMPAKQYEALFVKSNKEPKLARLETLKTLDNNEFWNPKSMETLIFNSYVGGACIFEFHDNRPELLRVNEQYAREMRGLVPENAGIKESGMMQFLDDRNRNRLFDVVYRAISTRDQAFCELRLTNGRHIEYVRVTVRLIATAGERRLLYCAILNTTEQHEAKRKELESAQQLQVIMDNVNGGVSAIQIYEDGTSQLVFNNERYFALFGYTREQAQAEKLDMLRLIVPEDLPGVLDKVKTLRRNRRPVIIDYRCVRRDGKLVYIRANCSLMTMDRYGEVVASVLTDITEQRLLEDQLRALVNNINGGVTATVIRNGQPRFIVVNDQYYRMLGYTREEYEAESFDKYSLIHPDDRDRIVRQFESADGGKTQYSMEYRILRRDGEVRWIRNNISVVKLFGVDEPVQLSVTNDVTDLRLAEQEVRATSDKLRSVLNSAGNGITALALYPEKPELLLANDKFFEIIGWTREEYLKETATDVLASIDPDDRERLHDEMASVVHDGDSATLEFRVARPDEKTMWVRAVVTITHFSNIEVPVQIAVFSDITAERKAGDQFRFLNDVAHDILSQPDSDRAIENTLRRLLGFFSGDRAFVVELVENDRIARNTYEVCADGVRSEMANLQNIPANEKAFWLRKLRRNNYVIVDDVKAMTNEDSVQQLLLGQGIRSLILAPLWRNGALIGFVGLDNPAKDTDRLDRLSALGDYIAFLLTRRDLTRRIEHARDAMQQLLDNLPCGAALYSYDNNQLRTIHLNRRYAELVNRQGDALNGRPPMEAVHQDDRQVVQDELRDAVVNGRDAACDIRIRYGEDSYRPFHVNARITRAPEGGYMLYAAYTPLPEHERSFRELLPFIFSFIMESSTDLAFAKDRNFRYLCCSRSFAALLGLKNEQDVVGKTDYELFSRELADQFRHDDSVLISDGRPQIDVVESIPSPNGRLHYTRTSKHLLRNTAGEAIGVYGVGRDITESRETYAQLKLMTDSIPGGLATYACTGDTIRITYCNNGFCTLFGTSMERFSIITGVDPLRYVRKDDRAEILRQYAKLVRDGSPIDCIYRIQVNGVQKWIHHRGVISDRHNDTVFVNAALFDITRQQEEKERLWLNEEEYRIATEHSNLTICRYSIAEKTLDINPGAAKRLSLPERMTEVPEGRIRLGLISPDTVASYRAFYQKIRHGEKECAATFCKKLGIGWRWLSAHATVVFDERGKPVSAIISYVDVTEQQEKEAIYRKWQQNLQDRGRGKYTLYRCNLNKNSAYDTAEGTLLDFHVDQKIIYTFKEQVERFAQHCVVQEDRECYRQFLNADTLLADYYRGRRSGQLEFRGKVAAGDVRWMRLSVEMVEYPNSTDVQAYLMYEDIHDAKTEELLTREQAETDPLTGLLNRAAFARRMQQILNDRRKGLLYALLLLDLDGFKLVNDNFGHSEGDRVLVDVGKTICSVVKETDLVCRMGGDEFLVFLTGRKTRNAILKIAKQICTLTHGAFNLEVRMTVSLGIAVCPQDGTDFDMLYKKADKALYRVKGQGKDGCAFYSDEAQTQTEESEAEQP